MLNEKLLLLLMNGVQKVQGWRCCHETIRKYWSSLAVLTAYTKQNAVKEVPMHQLLPGELSAVIFKVGCYTVRSAQRVYNVYEPGYSPEMETPASAEDVKLVRKDTQNGMGFGWFSWSNRLRVTHEISARHKSDLSGKFTYICRAAESRNHMWYETIEEICSAKKNLLDSDSKASLFIHHRYCGDSFGATTWYKLDPDGKIETLYLHDLNENQDDARFMPLQSGE